MQLALNHMVAPNLGYEAFFDLAKALSFTAVEIRNDIATSLMDMASARKIRGWAEERGLTIASVNALQRFNQWNTTRAKEAEELAAYAGAVGTKALVLCPVNDTSFTLATAERLGGLREALKGLAPILKAHGLKGFVEPLGFVECSLRLKAEAIAAIDDTRTADVFALVHDTFHHALAHGGPLFPDHTGIVHVSGVIDQEVGLSDMRDPHRILVTNGDRLGNVEQIAALEAAGWNGPVSYEAFSPAVHAYADPAHELAKSFDVIRQGIAVRAA